MFQRLMERLESDKQKILAHWATADFEDTYARALEQGDVQRINWLLNKGYEDEQQET